MDISNDEMIKATKQYQPTHLLQDDVKQNSACDLGERDINDVFEEIMQCEDQIAKQSYREGLEIGEREGKKEGYLLGYGKGLEIGQELGDIYAFVICQQTQATYTQKTKPIMQELKTAIENFPHFNDHGQDVLSMLARIRKLNKVLHSSLKNKKSTIDTKIPPPNSNERIDLSF